MIAVVQRVNHASVEVAESGYQARIGCGLCVLLAVEQDDTQETVDWMAGKLARLRIFADEHGKMNRSVQEISGEILLISQFTLAGNCNKGNRPSFVAAADPEMGKRLYKLVAQTLRDDHNLPVATGQFAAMMDVSLVNSGPVTLILRQP